MPVLTRKGMCFVEYFRLKFIVLLLCLKEGFLVEEQIPNFKKYNIGQPEHFPTCPRSEEKRSILQTLLPLFSWIHHCFPFFSPLLLS